MRVLTADDDPVSREMLAAALQEAGHEVVVANDGAAALAELHRNPCPIVVSDWMMPEMDGLELCRSVRRLGTGSYTYFILLTSRSARQDRMTSLEAGVDDFLSKPVDPVELCARMRNANRLLSLETRNVAIFALAKLAESRDPETGAHLERVRGYCRLLAEHLRDHGPYQSEVDDEFAELIYLTSPLHDIGKVGIPDRILLKPGRYNDAEFDTMKQHTLLGAETLGALARQFPAAKFLQMAHEIALTHHERWDGSGYPHGLRGQQIPLSGRITAVADVYDALTSKRIYKAALSHAVTRDMILEESGCHFDPALIEAFTTLEPEFLKVRERFVDRRPSAQSLFDEVAVRDLAC